LRPERLKLTSVDIARERCVDVREDERERVSSQIESRHDAGCRVSGKVLDGRLTKSELAVEPNSVGAPLRFGLAMRESVEDRCKPAGPGWGQLDQANDIGIGLGN
jgi:hypothetical protein